MCFQNWGRIKLLRRYLEIIIPKSYFFQTFKKEASLHLAHVHRCIEPLTTFCQCRFPDILPPFLYHTACRMKQVYVLLLMEIT